MSSRWNSLQSSGRNFPFPWPHKQGRKSVVTDICVMPQTLCVISLNPQNELTLVNLPIYKWRNWFSGKLCDKIKVIAWSKGAGILASGCWILQPLSDDFYLSHGQWGIQVSQTWGCCDLAVAIYSLFEHQSKCFFIKPLLCSRHSANCYGKSEMHCHPQGPSRIL